MNFVNQKHIINELEAFAEERVNFLLRANYGMGKTRLAIQYGKSLGRYIYYNIPPKQIDTRYRCVIVDEAHLIKDIEIYYDAMDKHYATLMFMTTDTGKMPNAFKSRCFPLQFVSYTMEHMTEIVWRHLNSNATEIEVSQAEVIARRGHMNPRLTTLLASRVWRLIAAQGKDFNIENICLEFDKLGIDAEGCDHRHRAYYQYLSDVGICGIGQLSFALGIDEEEVRNEIEPYFIRKGLIRITSSGRKLIKC